jgi:hypothetical protein
MGGRDVMLPTSTLSRQASALVLVIASVLSTQSTQKIEAGAGMRPVAYGGGTSRQGSGGDLETRLPVAPADGQALRFSRDATTPLRLCLNATRG